MSTGRIINISSIVFAFSLLFSLDLYAPPRRIGSVPTPDSDIVFIDEFGRISNFDSVQPGRAKTKDLGLGELMSFITVASIKLMHKETADQFGDEFLAFAAGFDGQKYHFYVYKCPKVIDGLDLFSLAKEPDRFLWLSTKIFHGRSLFDLKLKSIDPEDIVLSFFITQDGPLITHRPTVFGVESSFKPNRQKQRSQTFKERLSYINGIKEHWQGTTEQKGILQQVIDERWSAIKMALGVRVDKGKIATQLENPNFAEQIFVPSFHHAIEETNRTGNPGLIIIFETSQIAGISRPQLKYFELSRPATEVFSKALETGSAEDYDQFVSIVAQGFPTLEKNSCKMASIIIPIVKDPSSPHGASVRAGKVYLKADAKIGHKFEYKQQSLYVQAEATISDLYKNHIKPALLKYLETPPLKVPAQATEERPASISKIDPAPAPAKEDKKPKPKKAPRPGKGKAPIEQPEARPEELVAQTRPGRAVEEPKPEAHPELKTAEPQATIEEIPYQAPKAKFEIFSENPKVLVFQELPGAIALSLEEFTKEADSEFSSFVIKKGKTSCLKLLLHSRIDPESQAQAWVLHIHELHPELLEDVWENARWKDCAPDSKLFRWFQSANLLVQWTNENIAMIEAAKSYSDLPSGKPKQ